MDMQEFRKANGLTRRVFAEMIGVDPMTVYRYETGRRRPSSRVLLIAHDATNGKVKAQDCLDTWKAAQAEAAE